MLPKGHIEDEEIAEEAAVREVNEEAGIWARVRKPLAQVHINPPEKPAILVQFYLMEFISAGRRREPEREIVWLPWRQASDRASHPESKEMLKQAGRLLGDESVPSEDTGVVHGNLGER